MIHTKVIHAEGVEQQRNANYKSDVKMLSSHWKQKEARKFTFVQQIFSDITYRIKMDVIFGWMEKNVRRVKFFYLFLSSSTWKFFFHPQQLRRYWMKIILKWSANQLLCCSKAEIMMNATAESKESERKSIKFLSHSFFSALLMVPRK